MKSAYIKPETCTLSAAPLLPIAESLTIDKDEEHDDWGDAKSRTEEIEDNDTPTFGNLW